MSYNKLAALKTPQVFRQYLSRSNIALAFDDQVLVGEQAPLAQPYLLKDGRRIGNRFCIQPMEGWDGTLDGRPTELTFRRWQHFGSSGAKLIWGGEATAVCHAGRANPNQLWLNEKTLPDFIRLRESLVEVHEQQVGSSHDLLVGLQLTHSGRYSRPAPKILYHHPYLDRRLGLGADYPLLTDAEIEEIIWDYLTAADLAVAAGFEFLDLKHCHGYLGHEFLSAFTRPGDFGGPFENRTHFLRRLVAGIRLKHPGLRLGVRVSAFDGPPFRPDADDRTGKPEVREDYGFGFGLDPQHPLEVRLDEPVRFLALLQELGIELVNITGGSPYYNPHLQRPAYYPPGDGYLPPEDPLHGVVRQIGVTAQLKAQFPDLLLVGSAYSYLQEWLPHVAQYNLRSGAVDFIGLGRLVLSYPEFPGDVLAGRTLDQRKICRTFSDCTTAPRNGLVSGCYPLDPFYKGRPEAETLVRIKHPAAA